MAAHFVIKQTFNGGEIFAVEFFHECKRSDGRAYPHSCIAISDETAARPLNDLITEYKAGIRPKKSPSQPQA